MCTCGRCPGSALRVYKLETAQYFHYNLYRQWGKMAFQIFPDAMYKQTVTPLLDLPVEMLSHTLRMLDGESLLCAIAAYDKLLQVCKGDKCLRRRAKMHITQMKDTDNDILTNYRIGETIVTKGRLPDGNVTCSTKSINKTRRIYLDKFDLRLLRSSLFGKRTTKRNHTPVKRCLRL